MGGVTVREGDVISINGTTGEIVVGEVAGRSTPEPTGQFGTILGWADEYRRLKVRTNADLPEDARRRASSAPRASGSAAPSTCSSATGCRSCSA